MSLNFNLTKIEDYKKVCWLPIEEAGDTPHVFLDVIEIENKKFYLNPKTHAIIWRTMPLGIGIIAKRNIEEFWARNLIWLRINNLPEDFSLRDLQKHIGLSTNVFPEETRTKWMKRVVSGTMDDMVRGLR